MKVLVVGSGGQVGYELMRLAWPSGWIAEALPHARLDIADTASVQDAVGAHRPDLVVNAAAYTAVDRAESEAEAANRVNRDGAANLAEACATAGAGLIHLSTDYVFDGTKRTPYREDDPIAPLGVYGRSKEAGEAAIRARLPRHVILRTAWVFGAHGGNFVKTMLRLGAEREEIGVVDDQIGCPTPAAEIARAIALITARLGPDDSVWGTYHFTGAGVTSWYGFAEEIFRMAAPRLGRTPRVRPIKTAEYKTAAQRPAYSVLDCSRIAEQFGVVPAPWHDGLRAMLDAHFAA